MTNSTMYTAITSYQIYLSMTTKDSEKAEIDAINKCKEYLENGGEENNTSWLNENGAILSKCLLYYHQLLDEEMRDAKSICDYDELERLRLERERIIKYKEYFKDYIELSHG